MTLIRNLPQAEEELAAAADYYDQHGAGLGKDFLREFDNSLKIILERPETAPKISRNVRKERMNRFPYAILFRVKPEETIIVAVMHTSRQPGYWSDRI